MARRAARRALAGLFQGLAQGTGLVAQDLYRQRELQRQEAAQSKASNAERQAAYLNQVVSGELEPERGERLMGLPFGELRDLAPSASRRLAPLRQSILEATDPESGALDPLGIQQLMESIGVPFERHSTTEMSGPLLEPEPTPEYQALESLAASVRSRLEADPAHLISRPTVTAEGLRGEDVFNPYERSPLGTRALEPTPEQQARLVSRGLTAEMEQGIPGQRAGLVSRGLTAEMEQEIPALRGRIEGEQEKANLATSGQARADQVYREALNRALAEQKAMLEQAGLSNEQISFITNQTSQFWEQSQPFFESEGRYRQVQTLARQDNPTATHALIFAFARMISPEAVNEADVQLALNRAGFSERFTSRLLATLQGRLAMSSSERQEILNEATRLMEQAVVGHNQTIEAFTRRAQVGRVDPSLIVQPPSPDVLSSIETRLAREAAERARRIPSQPEGSGALDRLLQRSPRPSPLPSH